MLDRVKKALIEPDKLIQFRKDRLSRVFLYVLIFSVLLSTGTIVRTVTFEGLEASVQDVFRDDVNQTSFPCQLEDDTIVCDTPQSRLLYEGNNLNLSLSVEDSFERSQMTGLVYYGVLQETGLALIFMGTEVGFYSYETLGITRLDFHTFNQQTLDDLFFLIDRVILELRPLWAPVVIVGRVLGAMLLFNVFVLINTFILRMRLTMVPFKQLYVMFTYASTTLFVVLIFDAVMTLNIFLFILLLFFAFRQTSRLALELQKRLLFKDDNDA